jgi:signal transduction histidine kinase
VRLREDPGFRTAIIYAVVAGLWILASDSILGMLFSDPATLTRLATVKGWGFVAVTSMMLYGLIRRDIAEIKRVEAQLRQAQKLESLGLLAGGIAHDFNNLLAALLGNLNLAQKELPPGNPATRYLENAERTVLKASDLTKQMLAFAGRGSSQVAVVDLNQVVEEMTDLLRVSIPKKIDLRFRLAEDLPHLQADLGQLQQVVMNFVTNASDAIGDAEGMITIGTKAVNLDDAYIASTFPTQNLRPGAYVALEVRDTGSGMSPEVVARIFDPFFTTKKTGRGLGLSAMLGILRVHGAGIKIYTEVGQGSSFKLFFPAETGKIAVPAGNEPEIPSAFSGTVLLVDDEPVILESTAALLSMMGFSVITAMDGVDAVAQFEQAKHGIDLVLMDLTMPRMSGHEAFERMRALRADVPVILCSGYSEQDLTEEFRTQSATGFLQKPYHVTELKRAIHACLGQP